MTRTPHGSALEKSLAVLEAATRSDQAISLAELSAQLGLPRQTVHRVLAQLTEAGLLKRSPERERYAVGPRLSQLAVDTLVSSNRDTIVRANLQALVSDINETCNIGILDGLDFIYLERIESDWPLRVHLQAGSRVPAYCTSGGKALLAHMPDRPRKRLLKSRPLKAHTATTMVDPGNLERQLAEARVSGYTVNDEEYTPGIVGIAVPVFSGAGRAVAALACHAPSARVSVEDLKAHVPKLKDAAARLSGLWSPSTVQS
jgi:DNA-binding IclR family transcriptional regulator